MTHWFINLADAFRRSQYTKISYELLVSLQARNRILTLITIFLIVLYSYWFIALLRGPYAPCHSDEYAYYNNARSFYENGTLHGVFFFDQRAARIGEFGSHGFAYTLLHGSIARLIGFHTLNMIMTNLVFLLGAIWAITRHNFSENQKKFILCALLLYITTAFPLLSYIQETIHLFFAVVITLLLLHIYQSECLGQSLKRPEIDQQTAIYLYCFMIALATLFRPSWVLWGIGLLPLAKTGKPRLCFFLIFCLSLLVSIAYLSLCFAPSPNAIIPRTMAAFSEHGIVGFMKFFLRTSGTNTIRLLWMIDDEIFFASKYPLLASLGALLWFGYAKKDRLSLAAGLIGMVNVLSLMLLYYNQRMLAPLFYLSLLIVTAKNWKFLCGATMIGLCIAFPQVIQFMRSDITQHHTVAREYQTSAMRPAFASIATMARIEPTNETRPHDTLITVLMARQMVTKSDGTPLLLCLPLRNRQGYPLRYTFFHHDEDLILRKPEPLDYVIAPQPVPGDDLKLLAQNRYFYFYQSVKSLKAK